MADRTQKLFLNNKIQGVQINHQTDKPESDKTFLERTNVKNILNNLLDSLYHHQPDDPINYIAN
jgi:hypothetical protein